MTYKYEELKSNLTMRIADFYKAAVFNEKCEQAECAAKCRQSARELEKELEELKEFHNRLLVIV